jgi:hypothetical protein
MSRDEINGAAAVFESKLAALAPSDPDETSARMAKWHAMIDATPGPLRRAIAGLDPADFDL